MFILDTQGAWFGIGNIYNSIMLDAMIKDPTIDTINYVENTAAHYLMSQ